MTEGAYRVAFTALSPSGLDDGASGALSAALRRMPGIERVDAVAGDAGPGRITAVFWIVARLGMAEAARDGSRLAKEGLKVAGLADSQLVELAVALRTDDGDTEPG